MDGMGCVTGVQKMVFKWSFCLESQHTSIQAVVMVVSTPAKIFKSMYWNLQMYLLIWSIKTNKTKQQ